MKKIETIEELAVLLKDKDFVTYHSTPTGETEIKYSAANIGETNAVIAIGEYNDEEMGHGFNHHFWREQENGTKTHLKFGLSPDACRALAKLYILHGVIKLSDLT